MIYNPNYRDQVFWESEGSPSLGDVFSMLKTSMKTPRVPLPASPVSKVGFITAGICGGVVLLAALLTYVFSKSALLTLVLGMSLCFLCMGILFIVLAVFNFFIYANRCTAPVKAVCVGYSISGNSSGGSNHHIMRCPVFRYTYGGVEYTAYDGIYENHHRMPPMGVEADILVDPTDPAHIKWEFDNRKALWFIAGGIIAILMSMGFIYLCWADEDFKAAALNQTPDTVIETNISE